MEEAAGMVTLRVKSGRYSVVAVIKVPDGYPMEGCDVELRSYNFPEPIARRHLLQVWALPSAVRCAPWTRASYVSLAVMSPLL